MNELLTYKACVLCEQEFHETKKKVHTNKYLHKINMSTQKYLPVLAGYQNLAKSEL
jgi:hypothetical protein